MILETIYDASCGAAFKLTIMHSYPEEVITRAIERDRQRNPAKDALAARNEYYALTHGTSPYAQEVIEAGFDWSTGKVW